MFLENKVDSIESLEFSVGIKAKIGDKINILAEFTDFFSKYT